MTEKTITLPNKSSIVSAIETVAELEHLPPKTLTPDQKANLAQAKFILSKAKKHPDMSEAKELAATIEPKVKSGGKVKKYMGGGKVYTNQNKRYAHGGKVSGRKAKYNG